MIHIIYTYLFNTPIHISINLLNDQFKNGFRQALIKCLEK